MDKKIKSFASMSDKDKTEIIMNAIDSANKEQKAIMDKPNTKECTCIEPSYDLPDGAVDARCPYHGIMHLVPKPTPPTQEELCGCEADDWGITHTIDAHGTPTQETDHILDDPKMVTQEEWEDNPNVWQIIFELDTHLIKPEKAVEKIVSLLSSREQKIRERVEEMKLQDMETYGRKNDKKFEVPNSEHTIGYNEALDHVLEELNK